MIETLFARASSSAKLLTSTLPLVTRMFLLGLDEVIKPVRNLLVGDQFWRTVIIARKLRNVSAV